MLFIAFIRLDTENRQSEEIQAKAQKWWNEGARPQGLRTIAAYGAIGTDTPDVTVFEADDPHDIQTMINFWAPIHLEVHPATDLAAYWRKQGMNVA